MKWSNHKNKVSLMMSILIAGQAFSFAPVSQAASSEVNLLANGSFEAPAYPSAGWYIVNESNTSIAWKTSATDNQMEIWAHSNGGVSAYNGDQHAELNAYQESTLYQDVETTPGQVLVWHLAHRGNRGTDVMKLQMGAPGDFTQPSGKTTLSTPEISGTSISYTKITNSTGTSTLTSPYSNSFTMSDGNTEWGYYTGYYTVPEGQTTTRFAFTAVSSATGAANTGNFLDDVFFGTAGAPPVATNVSIAGTLEAGQTVTGSYTYSDDDGDVESVTGSVYQWHSGSQSDGSDKTPIVGATGLTYTITDADIGKYLFYEVTPKAQTGMPAGVAVVSEPSYVVPADKTALQNIVDKAKGLTASNYTAESWKKLEEVLAEAERVLEEGVRQVEVDKALDDLQQALTDLVPVKGELDQLNLTDDAGQAIVLSPAFDTNQYNYTATVTNDVYSISINPAALYPVDTEVRVSLNGVSVSAGDWDDLPLQVGENIVTVGVYDKAGNRVSEYSIKIFRESDSSNNKLTSLVPSTGSLSPAFDPDHESYTMSVANSVYQLQWTPTALDPGAKIEIRLNNGDWQEVASGSISEYLSLNVGTNEVVVRVTNKDGHIKDYTVTVTRASDSGGSSSGGGGGSTTAPTTPSTPTPTPEAPKGALDVTLNGNDNPFATGTTTTSGGRPTTSVKVDQDKLIDAVSQGNGQKLAIHSPNEGDTTVSGLTLDTLKQLSDKGANLEIGNLLAIYPVPASNLNLTAVAGQLGNAALSDIGVHIDIKRSPADLITAAKSKATAEGYELLVDPVDLDLTFSHNGQTVESGELNGYAAKYIALPKGIDPNRITTGVIVNPDGSVYHVPTVVTQVNNRYFALINDLRSSASYSVIWNPQDFDDVKNHWGKEDVNNIAARLDLKGNGDNTFSPNRSVTRSEFAEIVVTGLGLMRPDATQANFSDVLSSAWYAKAVAIANEFDIVRGYEDGSFNGNQQITREQGFSMIARAYRLIQSEGAAGQDTSTLSQYKDGASVSNWAKADVAQLIEAGIIQGNGPELLSPKATMTRAEVTALIARLLKTTNLIDK